MLQEAGLKHQVQGRYKRFYSIFEKLKRVDDDFEKIHDLTGFRVLVEHVRDCFTALSYIHERWICCFNVFVWFSLVFCGISEVSWLGAK